MAAWRRRSISMPATGSSPRGRPRASTSWPALSPKPAFRTANRVGTYLPRAHPPRFKGPDRRPVLLPGMSSLPSVTALPPAHDVLERFHPAVRGWFERRFPDGPTEAQVGGWPEIAAGRHTLVCAPTGSGKTLAGFLAAIDALYRAHVAGESIEGATQVVYLSPLKALAVDVHTNLERPLAEIAEVAGELGYEPAPITVGVRTGDSSSWERQLM